jgi:hypothetical protein
VLVPAGCVGPVYALTIDGGRCTEDAATSAVACTAPEIALTSTPLTCNLPHYSACGVVGGALRARLPLGALRAGVLGRPPGVYNLGRTYNLTRQQLGFSTRLRKVLNDFGVQKWYQCERARAVAACRPCAPVRSWPPLPPLSRLPAHPHRRPPHQHQHLRRQPLSV